MENSERELIALIVLPILPIIYLVCLFIDKIAFLSHTSYAWLILGFLMAIETGLIAWSFIFYEFIKILSF